MDYNVNILDYSIEDLRNSFKLDDGYTVDDVNITFKNILRIINQNEDLSEDKKEELLDFYYTAKVKLLQGAGGGGGLGGEVGGGLGGEVGGGLGGGLGGEVGGTDLGTQMSELKHLFKEMVSIMRYQQEQMVERDRREVEREKEREKREKRMAELSGDPQVLNNLISKNTLPVENNILLKDLDDDYIVRSAINQFGRKTVSYVLHFDTKFRKNYYISDNAKYTINLPIHMKNVISLSLKSLEYPNSTYLFDESRKSNTFTITNTALGVVSEIKIPEGNYDLTTFVTELNKIFANDFAGKYKIEISQYTGKTTISSTDFSPFTLDFGIEGKEIINCMGWYIGFRLQNYEGGNKYVSEAPSNFGSRTYIYFIVDDFQNNTYNKNIPVYENSLISNQNILAKIPVTVGSFNVQFDDQYSKTRKRYYLGPTNIKRLEIQIVDELNELVQLNHTDYSFSLEFECLYDY
jgi:hypothetical protein